MEIAHPQSGCSSTWLPFELEFENVGFYGMEKPEYLEKTSRSKGENQQQTQPIYGVDAGIWTRTAPSLSPRNRRKDRSSVINNIQENKLWPFVSTQTRANTLFSDFVIEGQKMTLEYSSLRCYWSIGDLTWRTCWVVCRSLGRSLVSCQLSRCWCCCTMPKLAWVSIFPLFPQKRLILRLCQNVLPQREILEITGTTGRGK